jgi:RNA 2',3'-cyclic 3'-phosphodiesterase
VRARLAAEAERLRPLALDVAWIARDNLHVTLKFLGGVEADRLDALTIALLAVAARRSAFDVTLRGLGAFPSPTRARVLWAGVDTGGAALAALAADVDEALAALGLPRETRAFSAHVTLGRVREPRANAALARALTGAGPLGHQVVRRVSLMQSHLSPRGARYTEIAAAPLAGSPE